VLLSSFGANGKISPSGSVVGFKEGSEVGSKEGVAVGSWGVGSGVGSGVISDVGISNLFIS